MIHDSDNSNLMGNALIKKAIRSLPAMLLAAFMAMPSMAHAQDVRKAKSNPPPEYPELARRLHIQGAARVRLTIAPDGSVRDVKEIGGNPVLVDALVRAVKKWRYEPADKTSVLEVKFDFTGD